LRFLFFTKTSWDEPPRLRHQVARLLAAAGHDVVFFERPTFPWQRALPARPPEGRIGFRRHQELIHHKLRLNGALRRLNGWWVKRDIRRALADLQIGAGDVVLNYNYDYDFLLELFPNNVLVTLINDDHVARALGGYTAPLVDALAATCRASDHVLTVSRPLQAQLSAYCQPQLFLPWADRPYRRPAASGSRDTLLFWGFITDKVDFQLVAELADALRRAGSALRMLFVGPAKSTEPGLEALRSRANIELRPAAPLDELPLERVFASIIPYRSGNREVEAIMLPNKALQLLARGLPLVISGMPDFIAAPFVFRVTRDCTAQDLERIGERFDALQPDIERFVAEHAPQARLEQLLGLVRQ
jgi:hypothetical protein